MFTMSSGKLIIILLFTTECLSRRIKPCQAEAKNRDGTISDTTSRPCMKQQTEDKFNMFPLKLIDT